MEAISLFSGAGGMDIGFHAEGFHTVLACEMNPDAAATFRANGLGPIYQGDVQALLPRLQAGMAKLVFGGPPCQGISVAGKMNPQDPRSQLIESFLEAVNIVQPEAFVMENVDALLTLSKWSQKLNQIRDTARQMGYGIHCFVANAADYGVPQSRKRFFAVGVKATTDDNVAKVVTEAMKQAERPPMPAKSVFLALGPQGTERNPSTSRAAITFSKNPVMRRSPYAGMLFNGAGRPIDPDRPAPTMTASAGGNKTHIVDEEHIFGNGRSFAAEYHRHLTEGGAAGDIQLPPSLRRLTIKESAAFQGFPADFQFVGRNSSVYRQIGNAVPVGLAAAVARSVRQLIDLRSNAAPQKSIAA